MKTLALWRFKTCSQSRVFSLRNSQDLDEWLLGVESEMSQEQEGICAVVVVVCVYGGCICHSSCDRRKWQHLPPVGCSLNTALLSSVLLKLSPRTPFMGWHMLPHKLGHLGFSRSQEWCQKELRGKWREGRVTAAADVINDSSRQYGKWERWMPHLPKQQQTCLLVESGERPGSQAWLMLRKECIGCIYMYLPRYDCCFYLDLSV